MKDEIILLIKKTYEIFKNQIFIIKRYLNKILNKDYIKFNIFSYAILILIVKKLNKRFKVYINYKVFNAFIILNRNISPLIKKTLFKFYIIRIYNKFDIIATFNKIRVKKDYKKNRFSYQI